MARNYYRWLRAIKRHQNKFYRHGTKWHYERSELSQKLMKRFVAGRRKRSQFQPNKHDLKLLQMRNGNKELDLPF